jgi:hypothetical protein
MRSGAVAGAVAGAIAGAVAGSVAGSAGADEFVGEASPIGDADLEAGAQQLGCELAALKAVAEVESRGDGFLPDKRPKILFEAHVFSRETQHKYNETHPDISSRKWNKALYKGGAGEYSRLARAIALDRAAALKSASWGRFQIMGFNHAACGFPDVQSFVAAMCRSEGEHLRAVVVFIKANPKMLHALRNKDWKEFAFAYNGLAAEENKYPQKLRDAYEKFS